MNYKIYSAQGEIVIGEDTITGTAINLMDLDSFDNPSLYNILFEKVKDGELIIQENEVDVQNGVAIISKAIQYCIDDVQIDKLKVDFNERKRTKTLTIIDVDLINIDRGYNSKGNEGKNFMREHRAEFVKMVNDGIMTSSDLFVIDKAIWNAKKSI